MNTDIVDCFVSANRELQIFLARVDCLIRGTSDLGPAELRGLSRLLEAMAPAVDGASASDSANTMLQTQIQEYKANLRAVQCSLEQVRCIMFARRAQIDAARRHIDGFRGWASAYRQTA